MIKYKATETLEVGGTPTTIEYYFDTEADCDALIASNPTYVKGVYEVPLNEHYAQVFQRAKAFGANLLNTFLLDNWQTVKPAITAEMSGALLTKFATVKQLCELGDIKTIAVLLPTIELDAIYTQARKDKYIALVSEFVTNNYQK